MLKYNKIYDGIVEVCNFLSKEECESLVKILENISEDSWVKNESPNWDKRVLSDIREKNFISIRENISKKITALFDEYYKIVNSSVVIQRILPKTKGLDEHRDNIKDPDVKYGMVLYINDNYEGGEIEYPELGVSYKPVSGSLIIHKGEYLHKVNEVFSGIRYMSTFFVHEIEGKPSILKEIEL